jgi:hypothetical protein
VFGAAALTAVYVMAWLFMGDSLRVRDVHVQGAEVTDPRTVAAAAALGGESLLLLDTDAAIERVTELPAVRAAQVSRRWPRGVAITIDEHQAWGFWQSGDARYAVDIDGRVLEAARPAPVAAPTVIEIGSPGEDGTVRPDADTIALVARLEVDSTFDRLGVGRMEYQSSSVIRANTSSRSPAGRRYSIRHRPTTSLRPRSLISASAPTWCCDEKCRC